ncbi:MAG: hypothetical protein K2X87_32725 [Gemmataceae bacterium]|nr:hypothetical protein [Gemmataceae bacterium]
MNPMIPLLLTVAFLGVLLVVFQLVATRFGVMRVEQKLDRLMAKLGVDPHPPLSDRVKELAREGRKIEAIKLLRAETGAGLAEAKAAVEAYQASAGG